MFEELLNLTGHCRVPRDPRPGFLDIGRRLLPLPSVRALEESCGNQGPPMTPVTSAH